MHTRIRDGERLKRKHSRSRRSAFERAEIEKGHYDRSTEETPEESAHAQLEMDQEVEGHWWVECSCGVEYNAGIQGFEKCPGCRAEELS